MTYPLSMRSKLLGVTIEDTSGTFGTVSAAATLEIYNLKCIMVDAMGNERMPDGAHVGTYDATRGPLRSRTSFTHRVRYNDDLEKLLRGAGYWEYDAVSNENKFRPTKNQANHKTLSMKAWEDGRYKPTAGNMAESATIRGAAGRHFEIDWVFGGKPVLTGDAGAKVWGGAEAMPSQSPYNGSHYMVRSNTLTLGSFTPRPSQVGMELGMSHAMREDISDITSYMHAIIMDHKPSMSMDPEATLAADHDAHALMLNGTTFAFTWTLTDGTNNLTIYAPRAQRINVGDEGRDGRLVDSIQCNFNASSVAGDNVEFRLPIPA